MHANIVATVGVVRDDGVVGRPVGEQVVVVGPLGVLADGAVVATKGPRELFARVDVRGRRQHGVAKPGVDVAEKGVGLAGAPVLEPHLAAAQHVAPVQQRLVIALDPLWSAPLDLVVGAADRVVALELVLDVVGQPEQALAKLAHEEDARGDLAHVPDLVLEEQHGQHVAELLLVRRHGVGGCARVLSLAPATHARSTMRKSPVFGPAPSSHASHPRVSPTRLSHCGPGAGDADAVPSAAVVATCTARSHQRRTGSTRCLQTLPPRSTQIRRPSTASMRSWT